MFACTLLMLIETNSPCLNVRYSCVYGRKAHVSVYAIRAYADELPVFACTLFVRVPSNSPC